MKYNIIEILFVLALTVITPIVALHYLIFHVGFIYNRDSYPAFYQNGPQTALSLLTFPQVIDNSYIPIVILLYFKIISPMVADWVSYLIFPFAISIPSMYWASRHFLKKFEKLDFWRTLSISMIIAFLYAVTPTAFYFSHWSNYAGFYALLPALIAGVDYSIDKKSPIALAFFSSLTTTDPRGFVFTLFIVITMLIFRKNAKIFLISIPFYILINIRLFLYLFINFHQYSTISFSISQEQLWLNYLNYPLLDSMRGLGLFRPLVPFYSGNKELDFIFSFSMIETGILGYIFINNKKKNIATYLLIIYLILVLVISSYFPFFGNSIQLNVLYPLLNYLSNGWAYQYLWIFLPTYLSEMVLAPIFLLSALVLAKLSKNKLLIPLMIFIIVSQLAFSAPTIASGNYFNNYLPQTPPQSLIQVADFLENHGEGNVITLGNVNPDIKNFYGVLPREISLPFNILEYNNTAKILNAFGVQYVVTPQDFNFNQNDFKEVFNNNEFIIYQNEDFNYKINSPIYLYNFPQDVEYLNNSNALPFYLMYSIPPKYLGGIIGNYTQAEYIAFKAYKAGIYPINLKVKHLPSPTNFTNSIPVNVNDINILSNYPGISFITVGSPSSLNIKVKPGFYTVIIEYITTLNGGTFCLSNGSVKLGVSTSSFYNNINFTILGNISTNGNLTLSFRGNYQSYLLGIILVPKNENFNVDSHVDSQNITSLSYSGNGLGRIYGEEDKESLIPIYINVITFLIVIFIVLQNRLHFPF
ncbi:hypothetical protein [Acidianus brierleyi]|uniref:DUF2079 domain-containing protein n=1 Tax=Acidianus brierleyi TaxID=41673 RepID=A0A2U9IE76_9CREN|nr:hypothetical protein [Acidianus brierleyi]AWR94234.1 hypothetical protein DFR85_06140 [Acidianus brierleyi]